MFGVAHPRLHAINQLGYRHLPVCLRSHTTARPTAAGCGLRVESVAEGVTIGGKLNLNKNFNYF